MSHSPPSSRESIVESRAAHDKDDPERLIAKVSVVIGIVTGVLGVLLAIGFVLLPHVTWADNSCIIIASFALSIAAVSGIGAWRSGRRFAVAAISTGLAIVSLAGLSVAAKAGPAPAPRDSYPPGGSSSVTARPTPASPTATASSLLTPNPSPPSSPSASGQSLVDMTPVTGGSSSFQTGLQSVKGQSYQQTLYDTWPDDYQCSGDYGQDSATYELNYKYRQFHVIVGLADSAPSGDEMQFSIMVDGQKKGISPTLQAGQTESINVAVAGAYRITLQDTCTSASNPQGSSIVAVWINPTVGP